MHSLIFLLLTSWYFPPAAIHSVPTSSGDLRPHSSTGPASRTTPVSYNTSSAASYASAVQIYTQKLSNRPRSASLSGHKTGTCIFSYKYYFSYCFSFPLFILFIIRDFSRKAVKICSSCKGLHECTFLLTIFWFLDI